jgi:chemotaxis protein histidine kinase CheA
MAVDPFAERLAKVRHRFVSALESKIEDSYAAVPRLSAAASGAAEEVAEIYRRMHGLVGIGPTVGFAATGRAARSAENVLLAPHHAKRGLTNEEVDSFRKALHALREAATKELQVFYSGWR